MSISGIIDTLSNAFSKGKKTERQEFLKRLHGYSTSQLANVVLAILVGSTVEMSIGNVLRHLRGSVVTHVTSLAALTNVLNVYLGSDKGTEFSAVVSSPESKNQLNGYILEALRSSRFSFSSRYSMLMLIVIISRIGIDPPRPGAIRSYIVFVHVFVA